LDEEYEMEGSIWTEGEEISGIAIKFEKLDDYSKGADPIVKLRKDKTGCYGKSSRPLTCGSGCSMKKKKCSKWDGIKNSTTI